MVTKLLKSRFTFKRTKNMKSGKKNSAGFTLVEILVVIVIIAVLTALAVLGYQRVVRGTRDKLVQTRLSVLAEAQSRFRVGLGRGRYASLRELAETRSNTGEKLVPETILEVDGNGTPKQADGWTFVEYTGNLRTQFGIGIFKDNSDEAALCIYEDGVIRTAEAPKPSNCTRTSRPLD